MHQAPSTPAPAAADLEAVKKRIREETPYWAEKFGKIVAKKSGRLVPFAFNPAQLELDRLLEEQRTDGKPMRAVVLKARQVGMCLAPQTRVLTADLRWTEIDRLLPGAELVSVDENPPGPRQGRRFRRAEVEARNEVYEPAFKLKMDNGQELRATAQHRFLCRARGAVHTEWREVGKMRSGDVIRHVTEPWGESGVEDGWFAGLIDGEGCLRVGKGELTVSQCHGAVFDAAKLYLANGGFAFREEVDMRTAGDSSKLGDKPVGRLTVGRTNELLHLLGKARTARFTNGTWWEGRELPGKRSGIAWAKIESIEALGERRMIDIQTSTATFIAEGFVSHNSTGVQGKLVHGATLQERCDTATVAHDRETGAKLYRMAETIYRNLPEDFDIAPAGAEHPVMLKPLLGKYRRQKEMHFAGDGLWQSENPFPDSRYLVDTAGEFQAGRGGTYRRIHGSEVGFWDQIGVKLTALKAAVPREPDTLVVWESTANGFNEFKDIWDDAFEGRSGYLAFFWPWWRQAEYKMAFATEIERERFIVGDPNNPYAEEEPDLVRDHGISLEQLSWRRLTIADESNGDVRTFHQEYPSTPDEAFISTGQKVFDPYKTAQLLVRVDITDPRAPTAEKPGPLIGDLQVESRESVPARNGGTLEVPKSALWTPRQPGVVNPMAPWRVWLPAGGGAPQPPSEYIVSVDVSGGLTETTHEPDYHAIEVIDHKTREQVAEYRSNKIDVDLLTEQVLLAALFFNQAYVVVERTGSWGQPVLRIMYFDFHYPFLYRSKRVGNANEKTEQRLGWDTNVRTKPILVAGMAELLRIEEDGIKSRVLAHESRTYTRNEKGGTEAEPGKYDDALMAYMIGQHAARELPMKGAMGGGPSESGFAAPVAGLGSYDARYR